MKVAAIVLAAGASTRMGTAKQLLEVEGRTMLRRAVESALQACGGDVIVVLGAEAVKAASELTGVKCRTVVADDWQSGMGASIRAGVAAALENCDPPEAILITLCDQPFVDASSLRRLIDKAQRVPSLIVASEYRGTLGSPALFRPETYHELRSLPSAAGAKRLIDSYGTLVASVEMPEAALDIDTPEEYAKLMQHRAAASADSHQ